MSADPDDPSIDFGAPIDIRYADFDNKAHRAVAGTGAEWTIAEPAGERQYRLKLGTVRGTNAVKELWIVRGDADSYTELVHLTGSEAERFVAVLRNNAFEPAADAVSDGPDLRSLPDAAAVAAAYEHDPDALRLLIEADADARDVIAAASRLKVVDSFRRMIEDDEYFDGLVDARAKPSAEGVWQDFFETNPWLLGLGLSTTLLVGWDEEKLEKVLVGADIGGPGKRADAVMRTAGIIGLLALAEIKHHRTDLLAAGIAYRSGCWPPSTELSGAVSQSHGTVQLALERLVNKIEPVDADGFKMPAETTYLYRPMSFVVIGQLSEFVSTETSGHHEGRLRSFELYRRNLHEPIVITFDELLARAGAIVALHERQP